MNILAIDSAAGPASCALYREGRLVCRAGVNTRLTHSQTLLPMVEDMLRNAGESLKAVDVFAVSAGPGSFTGVRIGVAAVKGLAFTNDKPCAAVSTLEAIAHNAAGLPFTGVVCAAMDARCGQVYAALFACEAGRLTRLEADAALTLEELKNRCLSHQKPLFFVGDGAQLCYNAWRDEVADLCLAPEHLRWPDAAGTAMVAAHLAEQGALVTAAQLRPAYLRLPQAERELRRRQGNAQTPEA